MLRPRPDGGAGAKVDNGAPTEEQGIADHIAARTAVDLIVTRADVKSVTSSPANDRVGSLSVINLIAPGPAYDRVVACATGETEEFFVAALISSSEGIAARSSPKFSRTKWTGAQIVLPAFPEDLNAPY
jgi:hypothetical protein